MASSERPPSPVRAVLSVWYTHDEGPLPRFSWVNGLGLGLMLGVDVLFALAMARRPGLFGHAITWILVLYAAGLTLGVARIRPRPGSRRLFRVVLAPLLLQLLVYLDFWARAADLWQWASPGSSPSTVLDVTALACFVCGAGFVALAIPWTRRYAVLLLAESVCPLAFLILAAS